MVITYYLLLWFPRTPFRFYINSPQALTKRLGLPSTYPKFSSWHVPPTRWGHIQGPESKWMPNGRNPNINSFASRLDFLSLDHRNRIPQVHTQMIWESVSLRRESCRTNGTKHQKRLCFSWNFAPWLQFGNWFVDGTSEWLNLKERAKNQGS